MPDFRLSSSTLHFSYSYTLIAAPVFNTVKDFVVLFVQVLH